MSIESYAVHIAPRGGKIDLIVDMIITERRDAQKARWEYAKANGAIGLYQNDSHVNGLIFPDDNSPDGNIALPDGWMRQSRTTEGVIAVPKKPRNRTKEAKAEAQILKSELAALPALPDNYRFGALIGSSHMAIYEGGRLCIATCWCERVNGLTFVMTPWHTEKDETGENVEAEEPTEKTRVAFIPEGCERVGLARYFVEKESAPKKQAVA